MQGWHTLKIAILRLLEVANSRKISNTPRKKFVPIRVGTAVLTEPPKITKPKPPKITAN